MHVTRELGFDNRARGSGIEKLQTCKFDVENIMIPRVRLANVISPLSPVKSRRPGQERGVQNQPFLPLCPSTLITQRQALNNQI